ncbi:unknown; predicted coding region [Mycoplasmopsis pulmonis]|uniref:Uncharacterized protein n=1 Tax=Mycoplasmopsis pulmonis (strain UAB CTIP) TaxID=272635 RepID=Q98PT8_MYCPU|nr:unknown; predicted coding region [Mycoplasmopsis pulmonis]
MIIKKLKLENIPFGIENFPFLKFAFKDPSPINIVDYNQQDVAYFYILKSWK